ncbi:MAG: NAD+ synthase, partial [Cyanobacteria bacterium]|nr:NAD+ synthase [Cyanobacteriota bacterium]
MRIALIQCNPLIGDLAGNRAALVEHCLKAIASGASLGLAPELALWGYPPRDLLLQPALLRQQHKQLDLLASALPAGFNLLAGVVEPAGKHLFNGMALIQKDTWQVVARKQLLPSYDVFDEQRYFLPGDQPCWIDLKETPGQRPLR